MPVTRQRYGKKDYFFNPGLMGGKLLARRIYQELMKSKRLLNSRTSKRITKDIAGRKAIQTLFSVVPEYKEAWSRINDTIWDEISTVKGKKGDDWFIGRIDHVSRQADNKLSQTSLEEAIQKVDLNAVYTWAEWESFMESEAELKPQTWWLYVLTFDGTIQKVGITTDPEGRFGYYKMSSKRDDHKRHTYGLRPADSFAFLYEIGTMFAPQAKSKEKLCHEACCNVVPPSHGEEWFEMSATQCIALVKKVLGCL